MGNNKKYWGSINLTEIKKAIDSGISTFEGKNGRYLAVDVWVNNEADKFGNSCSIKTWNKETKESYYLANLKLSEQQEAPAPAKDQHFEF